MLLNADLFIGAVIIFVGLAIEIRGWKLHQQIVGISGFIIGLVVGDFIGSEVLNLDFIVWRILILTASSIGFTILFFVYMKISIGVTSGIVGALIVSGFTSSRTLAEWSLNYVNYRTNFNYPALIITFALAGYAGYRYYKLGYIILSTGIGSILVAYGGEIANIWSYSYLGIFLLISLMLGVVAQLSEEGVIRERRLLVKEFRFCPKCGKPIDSNSATCPKCGRSISAEESRDIS
jgi:hypothetical protein